MKTINTPQVQEVQSQIMGVLVNEGVSAKEAITILNQTKDTYLSRSFHVNSKEKAD